MKRGAVLVVALLALGAPTAQAATNQQDYELALRYWGITSPPACESVEVRETTPEEEAASGDVGFATAVHWGDHLPVCVIGLSPKLYPYPRCVAAIHEVGHLLGLEHSPDPNSVMSPANGWQRVGLCIEQWRENMGRYCEVQRATKQRRCFAVLRKSRPWVVY